MKCLPALSAFVLAFACAPAAVLAQDATADSPRQIAQFVSVITTVDAVDQRRRKVTLRGPSGNVHVIKVPDDVQGLEEVVVGDEVEIEFFQDMITEIREPTPEELNTPLRIVEARPEDNPSLRSFKTIHAVVTIEKIDADGRHVTVRGPMGGTRTLPVIFPERLENVEAGSTAIITYTEAMAVSLVER